MLKINKQHPPNQSTQNVVKFVLLFFVVSLVIIGIGYMCYLLLSFLFCSVFCTNLDRLQSPSRRSVRVFSNFTRRQF